MTMYEGEILLNYAYLSGKEGWEQTRLQMWAAVQPHSKKTLKPADVLTFPWEEGKKRDTSISNEDVARLKARAAEISKNL